MAQVIRMTAIEQCPSLTPTLYPGTVAMEPKPFDTVDAMCLVFDNLDIDSNKTPAIDGDKVCFVPHFFDGWAGIRPVEAPDPPVMGAARAVRVPCHLDGRRDRALTVLMCPSPARPAHGLTHMPTAGLYMVTTMLRFSLTAPP